VSWDLDLLAKWQGKVFEALDKRRVEAIRPIVQKVAWNRYVKALQDNWPGCIYGKRVPDLRVLEQRYWGALNVAHGFLLASIFESLEEGGCVETLGLVIRKSGGEITIEQES